MRRRPTAATVFGVLNIILGSINVTCLGMALPKLVAWPAQLGQYGRISEWRSLTPALRDLAILGNSTGVLAGIVLIAAGVGLLLVRPWARTVSIAWAMWGVFWAFFDPVAAWTGVLPSPEMELLDELHSALPVLALFIRLLAGLTYPVLLLVFMTRPRVVAALRTPEEPPPGR